MSNVYIQEPPTRGKVVLNTTVGDIEIELFSKECPLACRNFVQHCLDGYYDGTPFHRVVQNFIVQGGDPTGTGDGGESATGSEFADEFHTRLRYTRRGLVGMVNHGPNTNASQFFFTLGPTPELEKKNTLFGKIVGNTLFNMLKLTEGEIVGEFPVRPHKILNAEVISNPFDEIVARPRAKPQQVDHEERDRQNKPKVTAKAIKNYGLLSFGNEAEEDEEEITQISMNLKQKGTGKSAHDLANDATLSKQTVDLLSQEDAKFGKSKNSNADKDQLDRIREKLSTDKFSTQEKSKKPRLDVDDDEEEDQEALARKNLQDEIKKLKKELKQSKKVSSNEKAEQNEKAEEIDLYQKPSYAPVTADTSVLIDELMAGTRRKAVKYHTSHSASRESQTMDLLAKFRAKLQSVKEETPSVETSDETDGESFLKHRFVSTDLIDNVHDIYTNGELLTVYDPRNPMTKRRREESSQQLREKKHRGRMETR